MAEKSNIRVDLLNATDDELQEIKSEVLKRLAERAKTPASITALYDRHGSGHSRATPPTHTLKTVE